MWRGFFGGVLGALIVVTLLGNQGMTQAEEQVPEVIRARSFVLLDESGNVRAMLDTSGKSEKSVGLSITDEREKVRVFLGLSSGKGPDGNMAERPVFALFDKEGRRTWETPWPEEGATAQKETGKQRERPVLGGGWKDFANWRKLKIGMTANQVRNLMGGEPTRIFRVAHMEIWSYGPSLEGGTITLDDGQVGGWTEP